MLDFNEYQKLAMRTASVSDDSSLILNGALGLAGESGEVVDHIKKVLFQGHELDKEHLVEELGDICWYLAISSKGLGYDLETIFKMNVDKLIERYPNGFEVDRSVNRE